MIVGQKQQTMVQSVIKNSKTGREEMNPDKKKHQCQKYEETSHK